MELSFALFLYCGIQVELDQLRSKPTKLWQETIYLVFAIVFLILERDWVLHPLMVVLMALSVLANLLLWNDMWRPEYDKLDSGISLTILILLTVHFIVCMIK